MTSANQVAGAPTPCQPGCDQVSARSARSTRTPGSARPEPPESRQRPRRPGHRSQPPTRSQRPPMSPPTRSERARSPRGRQPAARTAAEAEHRNVRSCTSSGTHHLSHRHPRRPQTGSGLSPYQSGAKPLCTPKRYGGALVRHGRGQRPRAAPAVEPRRRDGDVVLRTGTPPSSASNLDEGPPPKGRRPRPARTRAPGRGQTSMKGAPEGTATAGSARDRDLVDDLTSMKGRPRRDGDSRLLGRAPVAPSCTSMKGRPRRDGDRLPVLLDRLHEGQTSMKGRPRRDGDFGTFVTPTRSTEPR